MKTFKGFTDTEIFTQIPDTFFHQLLNQIDDAAELKVTLYFLWHVQHMDGPYRALRESDFDAKGLGLPADEIHSGVEKAVTRGTILRLQNDADVFYLLNSPRGRAAAQAFAKGQFHEPASVSAALFERPNIFRLYEENIGPLTPLIADALKDAAETYPDDWIAEAIGLAVKNNKRSWRYAEAILNRWKEEGKDERKDRQDNHEDFNRYSQGKYGEYIKRK